ncbi:MAG: cupin domain-containing protein [Panacibacter sp.]
MENKYNESTPLRPEGDRVVDASMIKIDLVSFMEQIKKEATWANSDRNAITIFKSKGMRLVLIALRADAVMKTHTATGIISVQVLEGRMAFTTDSQTAELCKGQMLTLHDGIPHSVTAIEETTFLLTLALCN